MELLVYGGLCCWLTALWILNERGREQSDYEESLALIEELIQRERGKEFWEGLLVHDYYQVHQHVSDPALRPDAFLPRMLLPDGEVIPIKDWSWKEIDVDVEIGVEWGDLMKLKEDK